MIGALRPEDDGRTIDFWVTAWASTMPDIDFEARRGWIAAHLFDMRQSGQIVRAWYQDQAPLGFYTLFPASGLIEQICVSPEASGQGIGARLIGDAKTQTDQRLNLVVNVDNLGARAFYEKLGFVVWQRGSNPASGQPVLSLRLAEI